MKSFKLNGKILTKSHSFNVSNNNNNINDDDDGANTFLDDDDYYYYHDDDDDYEGEYCEETFSTLSIKLIFQQDSLLIQVWK